MPTRVPRPSASSTGPSRTARGAAAEELAAGHLISQGYRIVARNHRCAGGEIDIIAYDGDTLCFVEVRSLANPEHGDPLETIDRRKIGRVVRAARNYLETLSGPWPEMRFDAIGIVLTEPPDIRLVREAFEASAT